MKKSLSLLLATLLLPMALGAQLLSPNRLADNQMLVGHYTTDDLATTGWGKPFLSGNNTIATDLTADELAMVQGSEIKAIRIGLYSTTPVTRVFVIPVYSNGSLGTMTEWECDFSSPGWNLVELETPYQINLPADAQLRVGFDYVQNGTKDAPISAVKVGDIYPTYHFRNGNWMNYGVNVSGNLSLQVIVEGDDFADYIIKARYLTILKTITVSGEDIPFKFETCNLGVGTVEPGACTYAVAIDGEVITYITNPETLTTAYTTISGTVSTTGLSAGEHTLTVSPISIYGEPIEDPIVLSGTFKNFENGFPRQMRLIEELTSHSCTYCPLGAGMLHELCHLRDDIALVAIHGNLSSADPFKTAQCDTIMSMMAGGTVSSPAVSYPTGAFDRMIGFDTEDPNALLAGLGFYEQYHQEAAQMYSDMLNEKPDVPAFGEVNINSTYDPETRKAVITVDGELAKGFDGIMGADCKLTVYITEDHLIAPQLNLGTWEQNYEHNNVFRLALGSARGVALKRNGDAYKNEFTVDIPTTWKADNLSVVAFISRPLRANAYNDLYVNNANKRKLGEFDEPTVVPGDINGDTDLDVADVTLLIDYILNGVPEGVDTAIVDLNGDNEIDVADVTRLISLILTGE